MSNKSEQLQFKLEKNIGIQKHAGKVRKCFCLQFLICNSVLATNVVESGKVTVTFSLKIPLQRVSFQAPELESTVYILGQ
jgi:hypothetical protein